MAMLSRLILLMVPMVSWAQGPGEYLAPQANAKLHFTKTTKKGKSDNPRKSEGWVQKKGTAAVNEEPVLASIGQ